MEKFNLSLIIAAFLLIFSACGSTDIREQDAQVVEEGEVVVEKTPEELAREQIASKSDFDISTIGEYPYIEDRIRAALGKETGTIEALDFLAIEVLYLESQFYTGEVAVDLSPLTAMLNLEELNIIGLEVENLGMLGTLEKLERFKCNTQSIMLSEIAKLQHLKQLSLRFVPVNDVSMLTALSELEVLDLNYTGLIAIEPIAEFEKLKELNLAGNKIADISALAPLADKLEVLWLQVEPLESVEVLSDFHALRELHLSRTGTIVTDFPPITLHDFSPISNCTNLVILEISSSGLSDLSVLEPLEKLEVLIINNNKISDISPLENLISLRELNLTGNTISDLSPVAHVATVIS